MFYSSKNNEVKLKFVVEFLLLFCGNKLLITIIITIEEYYYLENFFTINNLRIHLRKLHKFNKEQSKKHNTIKYKVLPVINLYFKTDNFQTFFFKSRN